MDTVHVQMLQDCISFENHLLQGLEELLQKPAETASGRRVLLRLVDLLLDELPRELGLKSEHGYLEEVVVASPELSAEVEQLRLDHLALWDTLRTLRLRAGQPIPTADRQELRDALAGWRETFLAQRRHEVRLVQDASNRDVGGEG